MFYFIGIKKIYPVLIDAEDFEKISQHKWTIFNKKYARSTPTGILMHRFILDCPKGFVIDHINGNGLDNRKANLRICTQQQNLFNGIKRSKTSQYKGVCYSKNPRLKNKWAAQITKDYKTMCLGHYPTELEAAIVYNKYASKMFGSYARLNQL